MYDYIRIACAVPEVYVGDPLKNAEKICAFLEQAEAGKADVVLFPELAVTGYTCADLFFQDMLWQGTKAALRRITEASARYPELTVVVGLPVRVGSRLYNCASVIARGLVAGLVPKTHLTEPERRWFSPAEDLWLAPEDLGLVHSQDYYTVPMKANQLFRLGDDALMGIELCQDAMGPQIRTSELTVNGAELILNLSASHELPGKRQYRRDLVKQLSRSCLCAYAFASAGVGESTTDMVFSGHSLIAENGTLLREDDGCLSSEYLLLGDCDLGRVRALRRESPDFLPMSANWLVTEPYGDTLRSDGTLYPVSKRPFLPQSSREEYCLEIFRIQSAGLAQRLKAIGAKAVVGVSGGMDSTLALLVAVKAMECLGRPASDVCGVTMPCFGTTGRTYRNSLKLMEALGVTVKEIDIREAVEVHFRNIGHDPSVHNTVYENAQARERTQVLMDYAGMVGGIVVGTGDLSELALGWCTYNADQMSMYGVNNTVPKTLVPLVISAAGRLPGFAAARPVLEDILATPISPELLPPDPEGNIAQHTEDLVGPYVLHDFYLFHMLRYGFGPGKIYALACQAFADDFSPEIIRKWLRIFYQRFFTQQFKRSCMPDGVKAGPVGLSPRGDWKMPSDASGRIWLDEIDSL